MGSDCFCAICGGPFRAPAWLDDDDEQDRYDETVLPRDSPLVGWVEDVRLIGENPASKGLDKVYITGLAVEDDVAIFEVQRGSDLNCPQEDDPDHVIITAYDFLGDYSTLPVAMPFHVACRDMLAKVIGAKELDKVVLYHTFKDLGHAKDVQSSLCMVDYGEISQCQEQYWCTPRGTEYFVMDPVNIPLLQDYYRHLPHLNTSAPVWSLKQASGEDPFTNLPPETMLSLFSCMDIQTLFRFRAASWAAQNVPLTNNFWKLRRQRDMPWLFDFPKLPTMEAESAIDWRRVYTDLHLATRASSDKKIHGLLNRVRIWETLCPQIAVPYVTKKAIADASLAQMSEAIHRASSTGTCRLLLPERRGETALVSPLIDNYAELFSAEPTLLVTWAASGDLAGLQVRGPGNHDTNNDTDNDVLTNEVKIANNDWLTGLIVTICEGTLNDNQPNTPNRIVGLQLLFAKQDAVQCGESEGAKRLIYSTNDHFVVGIKVTRTAERLVSSLELLQQHVTNAVGNERIVDTHAGNYNMNCMEFLWGTELPPPTLRLSSSESGYWAIGSSLEGFPCEALVFGESEQELSDIVAIAADVQLGGFEVRYANRPTRVVGPRRQALRTMRIDGQRGERIMAVYFGVSHIPCSLRFVTTFNRQLVVGPATTNDEGHRWPPSVAGEPIPVLAGLHFWWFNRKSPKASLDRVGCLFLDQPAADTDNSRPRGSLDEHAAFCDPEPFSEYIDTTQDLWGPVNTAGNVNDRRTLPGNTVYWLDCTRPVAEVRVAMCHGTVAGNMSIVSLRLVYSDGEEPGETYAGANEFPSPPSDVDETTGQHWCWCHLGHSKDDDERKTEAHYRHDKWEVTGKQMSSLRIWLSAGANGSPPDLAALQMVADGGAKSPIWGAFGFEPNDAYTTVPLNTGNDGALERLKLYFASNNRHTTREDMVLTAIERAKTKIRA